MPIYLLSKALDPLFAVSIGTTAALLRIKRDQQDKHPERAGEIGVGSVLKLGGERVKRWWGGEFEGL